MSQEQRLIYVGMHDGVCAVSSDDGGKTWRQGPGYGAAPCRGTAYGQSGEPGARLACGLRGGRIPH